MNWRFALQGALAVALVFALVGSIASYEGPESAIACCTKRDASRMSSCLIECARAANPLSDEEGEDLVAECAQRCEQIMCEGWKIARYRANEITADGACVRAGALP